MDVMQLVLIIIIMVMRMRMKGKRSEGHTLSYLATELEPHAASDQAAVYQHGDSDCSLSSYLSGEDKLTVGLNKKQRKARKLILRR